MNDIVSLDFSKEGGEFVLSTAGGEVVSSSSPFEIESDHRTVTFPPHSKFSNSSQGLTSDYSSGTLSVNWEAKQLGASSVWEFGMSVHNASSDIIALNRLDCLTLDLRGGVWKVESFASAWGDEFRPVTSSTMHDSFYEVRSGRSSHGVIPLVYLVRESDGFTVAISPAWSGNWHVDVFSGGRVRAGISTWDFESALTPGESIKAPSVIVSAANNRAIAQKQLQEAVRDHWMARSETTDKIPVEWNHWWPYEDAEINEGVIFENAEIARDMAIDAIVIDAGWFGESNLDTNWTDLRGDWSKVNLARFPSGLEEIGRQINAKGLSSGIWVEIEAVGSKSQLRRELPEAMARDDGGWPDPSYRVGTVSLDADDPGFLGFVCLGSDAGWNYAYQSLTTVLGDINARWLKVDFNIDPGRGCTRTDHGHGPRDGLFRHYEGLYRLLDQVRVDFPELLIEACSSGGLRIDLGLAKHVHCFFLSDPDYTEHHSQVLFGAIQFLPPLAILHWPWSWWRNDYGPSQLDWDKVEPAVFDSMVRSAMFHRLGVSYPLGRLKPVLLQRLNHHLRIFKEQIAPVLKYSTLECLTDSPLRGGRGERWPAWQLSVAVGSKDEIIFISSIAMDLNANPSVFKPRHLLPTLDYIVTDLETGKEIIAKGSEINSQLLSIHAMSLSSWIIKIRPVKGM